MCVCVPVNACAMVGLTFDPDHPGQRQVCPLNRADKMALSWLVLREQMSRYVTTKQPANGRFPFTSHLLSDSAISQTVEWSALRLAGRSKATGGTC